MFHEVAHALIQKVFQDKIIIALLVILLLSVFVGGTTNHRVSSSTSKQEASDYAQSSKNAQALDPKLATDFLSWWMPAAFDFSSRTGFQNHNQAMDWMTTDGQLAFQKDFWTSKTIQAISHGNLNGIFYPTKVVAKAINPDGSVVVNLSGHLIWHGRGSSITQQISSDFLVKRIGKDLRIAGMYNRISILPNSSIY